MISSKSIPQLGLNLSICARTVKCCVNALLFAAYIWYIGHSEEGTGNWCFKDGTISFEEIFDTYQQVQKFKASPWETMDAVPDESGKLLVVISDCNYSGNWIYRCAKILDKQRIPPCGHMTRFHIRVYCSTKYTQQAQELTYSVTGVTATKDGDFSFRDIELSETQQTCCGDFTKFVCCRDPSDPCRMHEDIKGWNWTDIVTGKLRSSTYVIQGRQKGRKRWFIILLHNKGPEFIKQYKAEVKHGEIEPSKWGYVLKSGNGETPPKKVLNKVTQWTFV
jgi:hypothetical protein